MAGSGGVVVLAVHGLGGVGKSTLAARWAAIHATGYVVTWWITAATPADIDAGLAGLAVALQPALSRVLPLEALREGAVQWLAARSGWLVILDNVTDPADVAPLLARAPAGRYLITSRRASGWHGTAVPVRLAVLDPAEAQALLAAILTPDRPEEADGAAELCEELGLRSRNVP
jgi:NB-ARC domain-containing protein